jgi:hypothetical protein
MDESLSSGFGLSAGALCWRAGGRSTDGAGRLQLPALAATTCLLWSWWKAKWLDEVRKWLGARSQPSRQIGSRTRIRSEYYLLIQCAAAGVAKAGSQPGASTGSPIVRAAIRTSPESLLQTRQTQLEQAAARVDFCGTVHRVGCTSSRLAAQERNLEPSAIAQLRLSRRRSAVGWGKQAARSDQLEASQSHSARCSSLRKPVRPTAGKSLHVVCGAVSAHRHVHVQHKGLSRRPSRQPVERQASLIEAQRTRAGLPFGSAFPTD